LDDLHLLLQRATEIGQSESQAAQDRGWPVPDCLPIRYETEELAISLSRWLFQRFGGEQAGSPDETRLGELAFAAADLLQRTEIFIGESLADRAPPPAQRRADALKKLKLRLLINLIAMTTYAKLPIDKSRIGEWISSAESFAGTQNLDDNDAITSRYSAISPFGQFVLDCARIHLAEDQNEKHSLRVKLSERFARKDDLEAVMAFPYDKGRNGRIQWMFNRALDAD
jgi:hypothetical protein